MRYCVIINIEIDKVWSDQVRFYELLNTSYGDVVRESPERRSPKFSALALDFLLLQKGRS